MIRLALALLAIGILGAPAAAQTTRERLDNGLTVIVRENPVAPVVAVSLLVKTGTWWETPSNNGISNFVHAVMVRGTTKRSGAALAEAIAALKRYVELQPGQPNPEDSLGKVLRSAGDDQGSVEHYGEALQLDPTFIAARVGLADTLTLMGDYSNARDQYDRAISVAESTRDRHHAEYQKALVFFWEGHLVDGRKLLEDLAAKARAEKEPYAQFEIGFARALLATNAVDEFAQLKFLESFLQGPVAGMTEADRNVSLGAVWRERARAYASSGESDAADQAVHQLEELAAHTRDMVIENTYESAHGYALFAQGEVADAADELVTDIHNPLVLRQFILAQQKLGNSAGAEASRTRLKYLRGSTVEWFLVAGSAFSKAH